MKFYAAAICAVVLSQGEGAAGLYSDLLHELYHATPASEMVVADMGVAMRSLRGSSNEWLKQFDEVPLELRRKATQPSPTKRHRLDASLFPVGTRLVSAEAIEMIFKGSGVEENWSAFSRQFRSKGWVAFSDALVANDQLNAMVYYEAHCGGLCGEGGYAWLRRDNVRAPWRIAKKIVAWMS